MLKSLFSKPYSRLYIVGDNADWAIDEEAKALEKIATSLGFNPKRIKKAWLNAPQLVHYSSQFSVLDKSIYKSRHRISVDYFHGKPEDGESYRKCFEAMKNHRKIARIRVSNSGMEKTLIDAGIPREKIEIIPIGVDFSLFPKGSLEKKKSSREKLGIPHDVALIGSFQKDGVGWGEGNEPKPIKGPDIFIKVVKELHKKLPNLFVLLSGPSRGYVKNELTRLGIPFRHEFAESYKDMSTLYDALDLYLITSREEGGPKACLESMAKGIPLVTTTVGQCVDLVRNGENALMAKIDDVEELTQLSLQALNDVALRARLIGNGFITAQENSLTSQKGLWKKYFDEIKAHPIKVSIFHEFHKPPYGGGNQFLLALEKELQNLGVKIERNSLDSDTKAVLFNSYNFDFSRLKRLKEKFHPVMMHRVDGPISAYRGEGKEIDERIWQMNHELADKTIFQSSFSMNKHLEMGLLFKNATVIPNAADHDIFNRIGKAPFKSQGKIKLIASAWSDNPKKGGPVLAALDQLLNTNKYELTFVGRTQSTFKSAKVIEAVPSEELASILKQHDIYIAPSEDDPCSNALIEALSCGLPAAYLNSGGHPELVKGGGEPFKGSADIEKAIEKIANDYNEYQKRIEVLSMQEVSRRYLSVLKSA